MTERSAPKPRRSKRALRAWAWVAGIATFATPAAALGMAPKPPPAGGDATAAGPVVIVRTITRRVVVHEQRRPSGIRYVTPSGSGGSVGGSAPATSTRGS